MKIVDLFVMRGPNYWSPTRHKIIVIKLDLGELEREPTHQLSGFSELLESALPGIGLQACSHEPNGCFADVVRRGTWLGHVVEHIGLYLQNKAGMNVSFGETRSGASQGIYHILLEYSLEETGVQAARAAVDISVRLARGEIPETAEVISGLREIYERSRLGPSTAAIVDEALSRGIPCRRLDDQSLIVLGHGVLQKKIRATVTGNTSRISVETAKDKEETKTLLSAGRIPVPRGTVVYTAEELKSTTTGMKFPLVVKPVNGNHGRGVTTEIRTIEQAVAAFETAAAISSPVIVEEFIPGEDYRVVVVNYRFCAASRRTPATVTGDGRSTIAELVERTNADPLRGSSHDNFLTSIIIDKTTLDILTDQGLHPDSVPEKGRAVKLKYTANLSTGGTAVDVTDRMHPYNVFLAERIARIVGLDICGIDIIARDLSKPLTRDNGAVVEVNAGPGLRMHLEPSGGLPRNIAAPIVDMLFPGKINGRIPIVAITGTNGKTTTTRLTAHLAMQAGKKRVGYTTTDGIYILGKNIYSGDCTGPKSTQVVLHDPLVDFAVLECARGGLLRSGLAFDHCDISIVTNVSADHLGLKDINTLEEMARVKSVVPRSTRPEGYAILNADNDLVYEMERELDCRIALFSINQDSGRVSSHCRDGGLAAITENGYFTVISGKWRTRIARIEDVPLTIGGRADSMIRNVLPALLAAWISGWDRDSIREALVSFRPSPDLTPGRMNIFDFGAYQVMVDYAHNIDGMQQLKTFMDRTPATKKTGVIGIAGDRRNEDIISFAKVSATVFDEIIIRHDSDMRGRNKDEMTELLMNGITLSGRQVPVSVVNAEVEAVAYALDKAVPGEFITVCSEKVAETLAYLKARQQQKPAEPVAAARAEQMT